MGWCAVVCIDHGSRPNRHMVLTANQLNPQELGVWEPYAVKVQTIKTAIEVRASSQIPCRFMPRWTN